MELIRTVQIRVLETLCRLRGERGQTTAEYALVLLAAAAVAFVLITWASGNDALPKLFDAVVNKLVDQVGS